MRTNTFYLSLIATIFVVSACSNGNKELTITVPESAETPVSSPSSPIIDPVQDDGSLISGIDPKCTRGVRLETSEGSPAIKRENKEVVIESKWVSEVELSCDLTEAPFGEGEFKREKVEDVEGIWLYSKDKKIHVRKAMNETKGACESVNLNVEPKEFDWLRWKPHTRGKFDKGILIYFEPDLHAKEDTVTRDGQNPYEDRLRVLPGDNQIEYIFYGECLEPNGDGTCEFHKDYRGDTIIDADGRPLEKRKVVTQGVLHLNVIEKETYHRRIFKNCDNKKILIREMEVDSPESREWYDIEELDLFSQYVDLINRDQ